MSWALRYRRRAILFHVTSAASPSPFSLRTGRVAIHASISLSIQTDLPPMLLARGNFPLRIQAQSVGKVTGTRASTCAFDKSRVGSITSCCSCSCPVKALAATGAFTFSLSFCLRVRNGNLPNVGSAAVRMLFEMKTPARRNAPMSAVCGRPAAEPQRARVLLPYGPHLVEGWGPAQGA